MSDEPQNWSDRELVEEIDEKGEGLTSWEIEFIASMFNALKLGKLSEVQRHKLLEILEERC